MNKYEIYNIDDGYLISIDDELTLYEFYDVPKQIINIIKQLEQENNQLKEQRQELRSWLEEDKDKINVLDAKNNGSVKLGIAIGLGMCLDKLNELEGGKNE